MRSKIDVLETGRNVLVLIPTLNPDEKLYNYILQLESFGFYEILIINDGSDKENAYIFEKIPEIARLAGITNGYRVITNCGEDACQSVKHLHFHILGGEKLPEHIR